MSNQEMSLWQRGISDAPLAPMVDPRDIFGASRLFVELYQKYGPIFRLPRPGKPLNVLAGPEANTFMARYEDELFITHLPWEGFDSSLSTIGSNGMSEADGGQANRQRRARSSRSYSRARVLDQLPRLIELTHEFTQEWQPGNSVAVLPSMQRVVAEQLGQLLVRHGPGDYLEDFKTYLDTNITVAFSAGTQGKEAFSSPEYLQAKEQAHKLGRTILQEHRAAPVSTRPKGQLDLMVYALLKHKEVHQHIVTEVDRMFASGPLTWEKLKTMHALHGAAMETLRLYPVATAHSTQVAKPLTFAGYRLEPGDDVLLAMTAPHFLPELFPDPETFDIDRYHNPRNEHRQPGAYAPFGLGEHTCLGAGIAEIQLMVILATLLHKYELELDPPTYELSIVHMPTASPGRDFRVRVVGERGHDGDDLD